MPSASDYLNRNPALLSIRSMVVAIFLVGCVGFYFACVPLMSDSDEKNAADTVERNGGDFSKYLTIRLVPDLNVAPTSGGMFRWELENGSGISLALPVGSTCYGSIKVKDANVRWRQPLPDRFVDCSWVDDQFEVVEHRDVVVFDLLYYSGAMPYSAYYQIEVEEANLGLDIRSIHSVEYNHGVKVEDLFAILSSIWDKDCDVSKGKFLEDVIIVSFTSKDVDILTGDRFWETKEGRDFLYRLVFHRADLWEPMMTAVAGEDEKLERLRKEMLRTIWVSPLYEKYTPLVDAEFEGFKKDPKGRFNRVKSIAAFLTENELEILIQIVRSARDLDDAEASLQLLADFIYYNDIGPEDSLVESLKEIRDNRKSNDSEEARMLLVEEYLDAVFLSVENSVRVKGDEFNPVFRDWGPIEPLIRVEEVRDVSFERTDSSCSALVNRASDELNWNAIVVDHSTLARPLFEKCQRRQNEDRVLFGGFNFHSLCDAGLTE